MIRLRIIITIVIITSLLAGLVYFIASSMLLDSYRQIETVGMERNLARLEAALNNYTQTLRVTLLDWTQWDDTYQFAQDQNDEYIAANLDDATLLNLNINLMAYYNAQGELVYAKYIDLSTGETLPVEGVLTQLQNYAGPLTEQAQKINGILKLDQGLLISQALPILPTSGAGDPSGLLIFARFIDADLLDELSALTQLSLDLYIPGTAHLPSDVDSYIQTHQTPTYAVLPLSENELAGYFSISQPGGTMIAIARITSLRDVYLQGKETLTSFTLLTSAAVLVFGLITLVLLEVLLLRRFARLTTEVEQINTNNLQDARVHIGSKDEIGMLAQKIDHLLKALAEAQARSNEAAERAKKANEQLEQTLKETEEMNKLMVGRELKMIELKTKLNELKEGIGDTETETPKN